MRLDNPGEIAERDSIVGVEVAGVGGGDGDRPDDATVDSQQASGERTDRQRGVDEPRTLRTLSDAGLGRLDDQLFASRTDQRGAGRTVEFKFANRGSDGRHTQRSVRVEQLDDHDGNPQGDRGKACQAFHRWIGRAAHRLELPNDSQPFELVIRSLRCAHISLSTESEPF